MTTMKRLRTTIVAFVTLAVAAFPLAGASAHGVPSASHDSGQQVSTQHVSSQAGCEKHAQMGQAKIAQSKASHGQGHCGKLGGCGGKCFCFGLTAVLTTPSAARSSLPSIVKTGRVAASAALLAYIPPSPPPRV